jgi:hypothetical protein
MKIMKDKLRAETHIMIVDKSFICNQSCKVFEYKYLNTCIKYF